MRKPGTQEKKLPIKKMIELIWATTIAYFISGRPGSLDRAADR
jgi:hypothetical protein